MIAPDDTTEEVGLRLAEWAALEAAAANGATVPVDLRPAMVAMGVIDADGRITVRGRWALVADESEVGPDVGADVREPSDDYVCDCDVREPWSYDDLVAMRGAS